MVMAANGNGRSSAGTPRGNPAISTGSRGLTPQQAIVETDRTPTVFFFRWLLDLSGSAGAAQTPWTSDIDAAGYSLTNLGGLTLTGPLTFPDGTVQTTAYTGAGGGTGTGTVTSVGLRMPLEFTVVGSPVTTAGNLTVAKAVQASNLVYASPAAGAGPPVFRALTLADLPPGGGTGGGSDYGDTIRVNSIGISDDPNVTVNADPFFTVNTASWPQGGV